MNELRLSLLQMSSFVGERERNLFTACSLIDLAVKDGAELILLPELFSTGPFVFLRDEGFFSLAEGIDGPTVRTLRSKAREHKVAIAVPFFEEAAPRLFFDSVALVGPDGELIGAYRKTHLTTRPALEKFYFNRGACFRVFGFKDWRIGFFFGSEALYPEVGRALSVLGAELLLVPAACTVVNLWRELHSTRAFENGCYLGVSSLSGELKGVGTLSGCSLLGDPLSEILGQLSSDGDGMLTQTIRMERVNEARSQRFMLRDRRPDVYKALTQQEIWTLA